MISNLIVDFVLICSSIDYQDYYSELLFVRDDSGRLGMDFFLLDSGTSPSYNPRWQTQNNLESKYSWFGDNYRSVDEVASALSHAGLEFIEWAESNSVRFLGIFYGLQLVVQKLGGVVVEGERKEYGKM